MGKVQPKHFKTPEGKGFVEVDRADITAPVCPNVRCPWDGSIWPLKKMTTENEQRVKWWQCRVCATYVLIPVD
jgi:hypothetical protein